MRRREGIAREAQARLRKSSRELMALAGKEQWVLALEVSYRRPPTGYRTSRPSSDRRG